LTLTVICLVALAIALLFTFEVFLGYPSSTTQEGRKRLTILEFATGLLPLFLFGIGVASLFTALWGGLSLIFLSIVLWVYGFRSRT
jgi:hypothetical protein